LKKFLIILLLVLLAVNIQISYSVDTISTKYLPLKIGNEWTYVRTGGFPPNAPSVYYKCTIQRDTLISGHTYYYLSRSEHLRPYYPQTNWFRIDSLNGTLKIFEPSLCNQLHFEVMDSLSSSIMDSFKVCPNNLHSDRMLYLNVSSVWWGVQSNDKYFDKFWGPSHEARQYSKYFGLRFSKFGENDPLFYNLRGCVIDGVLFGDTNTFVGINQISNEIPAQFSLSQNYPNPFNPVTKIKFSIPSVSNGRDRSVIKIYNILGYEVHVLVNESLQPGTYEVDWDASNYPSGVYFYELASGNFIQTKKMVLLK